MPKVLTMAEVTDVMPWPLGSVKTAMAVGENWTDCVLQIDDAIRLGGKYNTRRVRYDGRFYITHNGRRVYIVGMLQLDVFEAVTHVYGINKDDDKKHNKTLKGY